MRSRSSSSTSSTSAKSLPADNIQIFVDISGGKTIPLNVRPSNTVSDVLDFLSASTSLPADVRLLHSGHHLLPSSTVAELALQPATTLHLLSPLRGGTASTEDSASATDMTATLPSVEAHPQPATTTSSGTATPTSTATSTASTPVHTTRKSNKPRCSHPPCKAFAQPIVGDCGFCQKRFCGKHRMLESHACEGLEEAKQADKDRNTNKLQSERTVMLRGI